MEVIFELLFELFGEYVLAFVFALCGASMALMGYVRKRRCKEAAAIESFGYGFLFAASLSPFRFFKAA